MLIKNAEALEVMEKVDTLVVDKTGTLTEGKPRGQRQAGRRAFDEERIAAPGGEPRTGSEHPLAAAIVGGAEAARIELAVDGDSSRSRERGFAGVDEGRRLIFGNRA